MPRAVKIFLLFTLAGPPLGMITLGLLQPFEPIFYAMSVPFQLIFEHDGNCGEYRGGIDSLADVSEWVGLLLMLLAFSWTSYIGGVLQAALTGVFAGFMYYLLRRVPIIPVSLFGLGLGVLVMAMLSVGQAGSPRVEFPCGGYFIVAASVVLVHFFPALICALIARTLFPAESAEPSQPQS